MIGNKPTNNNSKGKFIPITGTEADKPVSGTVVFKDAKGSVVEIHADKISANQYLGGGTEKDFVQRQYVDEKNNYLINNFIPITGTQEEKPVIGNIELQEYKEIWWKNGEHRFSIKNSDEYLFIETLNPITNYTSIFILDSDTNNFVIRTDNPNSVGLMGERNYTENTTGSENSDKLIFAQRSYVDKSNSYSTVETKTGGTWIDGKPIYRQVITKIINNTYDTIPFDFEGKEIIKQEVLFQDFLNLGNGHLSNNYTIGDSRLSAFLFKDDDALYVTNIANSVGTIKFMDAVKLIAIIEYTKQGPNER